MKWHLLHNIHNSDYVNEKKFKTHVKTCFTTNLTKNKSFLALLVIGVKTHYNVHLWKSQW